ncbi:gamma-glutamyltransferase [Clostridiaceae bacterium HSG29]|nr:gamma-glutamyltransferase [Clostridiaceae bacterium HSG29]
MLYKNIENLTISNKSNSANNVMVASARYEASDIGIGIMKKGGNAIDAAVAVGFALSVCEANASGLGGGGFMNLYIKDENLNTFIDFREIAPENASPSMWEVVDGEVVGNQKAEGGKSVCVPGETAGLIHAHKKYGKLDLKTVIEPAIILAETGIEITNAFNQDLINNKDKMMRFLEEGNSFVKANKVIKNPALANTLKEIMLNGADGFYKGSVAKQIVESINKHNGIFKLSDLSDYKVREMSPLKGFYKGYEIISSPLPSSGGTHILQILNILELLDISQYRVNSLEYIHMLSEVFKICFADRQEFMGDPCFNHVPIKGILSKNYSKELSKNIEMDSVKSYEYGNPMDYESLDTTHYSIVDNEGNMVSVTKTISAFFGSGVIPKNTGVVLNCQARGFAIGEGKTNSIAPKKKPLSSMSPTIIMKDGNPFAVIGTPGANRIITTMVQIIIKMIDYEMTMEDAIDSPRISNDMSEILYCEDRIDEDIINRLSLLGHKVEVCKSYDRKFGGVQGIKCNIDKTLQGAADLRRDGVALGY